MMAILKPRHEVLGGLAGHEGVRIGVGRFDDFLVEIAQFLTVPMAQEDLAAHASSL